MRVMLGIAIALPIAVIFCFAYLTALALEAWRPLSKDRMLFDWHPESNSSANRGGRLRSRAHA